MGRNAQGSRNRRAGVKARIPFSTLWKAQNAIPDSVGPAASLPSEAYSAIDLTLDTAGFTGQASGPGGDVFSYFPGLGTSGLTDSANNGRGHATATAHLQNPAAGGFAYFAMSYELENLGPADQYFYAALNLGFTLNEPAYFWIEGSHSGTFDNSYYQDQSIQSDLYSHSLAQD